VILSKRLGHDIPPFRERINTVSNSLAKKSPARVALAARVVLSLQGDIPPIFA